MNAKQRRKANRKHKVKFSFDEWDFEQTRTWERKLTDEEIMAEFTRNNGRVYLLTSIVDCSAQLVTSNLSN